MANPAWRASATANASPGTTVTVAKPTGTLPGDVLIAAIAVGSSVATVTAPANWRFLGSDASTNLPDSQRIKLWLYWLVVNGTEGALWSWTISLSKNTTGSISAYSDCDTRNPVDVFATANNGSSASSSFACPSVGTNQPNDLIVAIAAYDENSTFSITATPPSGMAERVDIRDAAASHTSAQEVSDVAQAAPGATGTKTVTTNNSAFGAMATVALRPPRNMQINRRRRVRYS